MDDMKEIFSDSNGEGKTLMDLKEMMNLKCIWVIQMELFRDQEHALLYLSGHHEDMLL